MDVEVDIGATVGATVGVGDAERYRDNLWDGRVAAGDLLRE